MLVLTRKTQQQIQIGKDIVITILHVKGQAVRVGIEAPRDVRVIRSEVDQKPAEQAPPSSSPAVEAPLARRAKLRVPGSELSPSKPFSSPAAAPVEAAGESHGLFPHLRRRPRAFGGDDGSSQCRERSGSPSLCSMMARNL